MGCEENISYEKFPKQDRLGTRVVVFFHYDTERATMGTIVRDDAESPGITLIKLDGTSSEWPRVILATECQYRPLGANEREFTAGEEIKRGDVVKLDPQTQTVKKAWPFPKPGEDSTDGY